MRIGIDLDGVVIDTEKLFKVYSEIYAVDILHKPLKDKTGAKHNERYDLTEEENKYFLDNYVMRAVREANIMPGFIPVYEKLKKEGYEFVVITARGGLIPELVDDTYRILKENNIEFDKYYFNVSDKLEVCKKENIDIMIDDDYHIIEKISLAGIKTLYFRDTNIHKLEENEFIYEVNNWGDIYRYFKEYK